MYSTTSPYHIFHIGKESDSYKWKCIYCNLTSNNEKPPCVYCGAEDGEKCKLDNCENRKQIPIK